jgi:predicted Zn-dependent protease
MTEPIIGDNCANHRRRSSQSSPTIEVIIGDNRDNHRRRSRQSSATIETIIAGIEEGLLVEDVLGIGQGNIIGGDFSNNLSLAFKIGKGEIVGRVKDVSIAGNVYRDLRHVAALSRETAWVQSGLLAPHVLLPELSVVT